MHNATNHTHYLDRLCYCRVRITLDIPISHRGSTWYGSTHHRGSQVTEGTKQVSDPIYQAVKESHEIIKATARLEARAELAAELKQINKPTKQVQDIIKRLENAGTN